MNLSMPDSTLHDMQAVSPALARYSVEVVLSELWQRPQLKQRDRAVVTLTILITRNQLADVRRYINIAMDNGVKAAEISELITHLAFYAGWPSAMAAIPAVKDVFAERGVTADELPHATPQLLPLDTQAEQRRADAVARNVGAISPGLVKFTADPLFRDLWRRPDLAPRDRSLVTVSCLIASGQSAQITYHLNRAMDNGLTSEEAGEVLAHAAFYAGWPSAFSAASIVGEVLQERQA